MFDDYSDDGNSINGVILFIVFMMIGIIVVCSVIIPFVIQTSTEVVENNNGEGMGIPLSLSTSADTVAHLNITSSEDIINITGTYTTSLDESDRLLVLSDKMAVYVRNGQLHYFNGSGDSALDSLTINVSGGTLNGVAYEWAYYPSADGTYRAYDPPIGYELGDVMAFGIYAGDYFISENDVTSIDTITPVVSVEIQRNSYGVEQVYYTWSD